ncbi:MAG TPA: proline-rich domain-containing protein [Terracidiphilus sp.]|jgi:hypothetical protein
MFPRLLAISILALSASQAPGQPVSQGSDQSIANHHPAPSAAVVDAAPGSGKAPSRTDVEPKPDDYPSARVTVVTPHQAPSHQQQDRAFWAAILAFAILGYASMALAVSTLRKIERQTKSGETAAAAAADGAQAALLLAQSIVHSERPWILISIEPSVNIDNGFDVVATNRGRTPARIVSTVDEFVTAPDETNMASTPAYKRTERRVPTFPLILVPGEFTRVKSFCRADVKAFCETEKQLKSLEDWEERLFVYGKVTYVDLSAYADQETHETAWCYWHIHGRRNSALVAAGPPSYNLHT